MAGRWQHACRGSGDGRRGVAHPKLGITVGLVDGFAFAA